MAGLNADARTLAKVMRTECLNHRYVYGAPLQGARLVQDIADKYQRCTQTYVRRPYGVGLLVACFDATGPHLYETCPSGNFSEFVAVAIGARAQSAKTYLEKHHKTFKDTPVEELCTHALQALACVEINRCAAISAPRPSFWLKLGRDRIQRATPHSDRERFRIEGRLKFYFPTGIGRLRRWRQGTRCRCCFVSGRHGGRPVAFNRRCGGAEVPRPRGGRKDGRPNGGHGARGGVVVGAPWVGGRKGVIYLSLWASA